MQYRAFWREMGFLWDIGLSCEYISNVSKKWTAVAARGEAWNIGVFGGSGVLLRNMALLWNHRVH